MRGDGKEGDKDKKGTSKETVLSEEGGRREEEKRIKRRQYEKGVRKKCLLYKKRRDEIMIKIYNKKSSTPSSLTGNVMVL